MTSGGQWSILGDDLGLLWTAKYEVVFNKNTIIMSNIPFIIIQLMVF